MAPSGSGLLLEFLDRRAGDLAAVDEEPAFGPFEQNAVVAFAGDDHLHVVRHVDADREFGGDVVLIVDDRVAVLVLAPKVNSSGVTLLGPVSVAPSAQQAMST